MNILKSEKFWCCLILFVCCFITLNVPLGIQIKVVSPVVFTIFAILVLLFPKSFFKYIEKEIKGELFLITIFALIAAPFVFLYLLSLLFKH